MKFRMLLAALFLAFAMPADAEIRLLQKGYEVSLANLRLPANENGTIAFRQCNACAFITKRVDADTRWVLNGQRVSLKKFRESVLAVPSDKTRHATVRRHLDTDRITRVSLNIR
ncbi:MAG: hypothetical protein QNJ07_00265 [Woeseiaceae bacterium]|nr:hypothetical protein [Woeseiaceae bacterium]